MKFPNVPQMRVSMDEEFYWQTKGNSWFDTTNNIFETLWEVWRDPRERLRTIIYVRFIKDGCAKKWK